jgi:eukaryotic-like serine/threonine-protein kinase
MNPGENLPERYEIIRELGRGGAGITYLARDSLLGREVVVKLLHFGLLGDWKAVELFEREAAVLKGLHHERIPACVDFFSTDRDGVPQFILVRDYVNGVSLQARVDGGWRGTEAEICEIGVGLLRIIAHIHSVRPPVIHRDINPRNIILREDAEVFLVDFGGVQDAIRLSAGATSTIVGTPGYTPMEQFVGRATVRSDLYAVAATLLFLLTHKNPADLPLKDMKIDFPSVIQISSPGLSRVLSNWLEPDESRRTLGEQDAAALLEGTGYSRASTAAAEERAGSRQGDVPDRPPYGSRISREVSNGIITFLVPAGGRGRGMPMFGSLWFFWVMFGGFWTSSRVTLGRPLGVTLMALPMVAMGISMLFWTFNRVFGRLRIEIGRDGLTYTRRLFFFSLRRNIPLSDVGECRLEEARFGGAGVRGGFGSARSHHDWSRGYSGPRMRFHDREMMASSQRLSLDIGARTLRFGEILSPREREWVRDSINDAVAKARALE